METFKIEIDVPCEMNINSRSQSVTLDLTKIKADMLVIALCHGMYQHIGDSASGAARSACLGAIGTEAFKVEKTVKDWTMDSANTFTIQAECLRMMEGSVAKKYDGDWGRVNTGTMGVSPIVKLARSFAREALKARLAKEYGNAKKFTALNAQAQNETLDRFIESSERDFLGDAETELGARKDAMKDIDLSALGL